MSTEMNEIKSIGKKAMYGLGAALSYSTPLIPGETQTEIAKEIYGDEKKAKGMTETSSGVEIGVGTAVNGLAIFLPELAVVPPAAVVAATYLLVDGAYRLLSKEPKGSLLVEGLKAVGKGAKSTYAQLVKNYMNESPPAGAF